MRRTTSSPSRFPTSIARTWSSFENKANGGRIYIFTPEQTRDGASRLNARLLAFWDGDGWINNPRDFAKTLAQHGEWSKSPAKIDIAEHAQTRQQSSQATTATAGVRRALCLHLRFSITK